MEKKSIGSYKGSRKAQRKQTRYVNQLLRETGIKCMDLPTKIIFIGNVGLVNGMKREDLLYIFSSYGRVDDLVLLPGKSYSFVVYKEVAAATKAFNAVHGKELRKLDKFVLYLAFAEKLPETGKLDGADRLPSGLTLIRNFVTEDEESKLLSCIDWTENDSDSAQSLRHRKVQHYGFKFRYDINNVDKDSPLPRGIPKEFDFLFARLKERDCTKEIPYPDQLTVNQYIPGQGIPPHIDTHSAFEDHIMSLSLGSSTEMEFEHSDGRRVGVALPRRSLLIMSGEARYAWKHGITPRKMDIIRWINGGLTVKWRRTRTSFTFRKVLRGECECSFHDCCDSFQKKTSLQQSSSEEVASQLEELHVHQVYERIASHFSETRHKAWPNVVTFLESLPCGSILVDVGCGNGKYFRSNADIFQVGCDQSTNLTKVCQERGFEVFNCNCLSLPLRSGIADGCISIAVIHHLSTQERRLRAVEEMARILRPGGRALIYVWAKNQECGSVPSNYLKFTGRNKTTNSEPGVLSDTATDTESTVQKNGDLCSAYDGELVCEETDSELLVGSCSSEPCAEICEASSSSTGRVGLPELPIHTNRTQFRHSDVLVPWKLKQPSVGQAQDKPVLYRYYHVFEEGELEKMCACVGGIRITSSYYDQGNWCVIFEKDNEHTR